MTLLDLVASTPTPLQVKDKFRLFEPPEFMPTKTNLPIRLDDEKELLSPNHLERISDELNLPSCRRDAR